MGSAQICEAIVWRPMMRTSCRTSPLLIFPELQDQRCGRFNKSLHFRAIRVGHQ